MSAPARALASLALMLGCWLGVVAGAGAAPDSTVFVDIERNHVAVELRLPSTQLAAALGQPLPASPLPLAGQDWVVVARYLDSHLHATGPDGRAWTVEAGDMRLALDAHPVALVVHADLVPPAGASARRFALDVDVIGREFPDAAAGVVLRRDWDGGFVAGGQTLARLRFPHTHLYVDAGAGAAWRGWAAAARLGMRRLAGVPGELLFLTVLLVTAPAVARHGRWTVPARPTGTAARAVRIAGAYALGHTLTLVAGGLGWLRMSQDVVDLAAACALLAAGLHALRPRFAGNGIRLAAGVGLVHGLSCAAGFTALGVAPDRTPAAVLAFHGGIELLQAATVAVVLPLVLAAACLPAYRWLRTGAGVLAATAGAASLGDGGAGWDAAFGAAAARMAHQPGWLLAAAGTYALACVIMMVRAGMRAPGRDGARRGDPDAPLRDDGGDAYRLSFPTRR